LAPVGFGRRVEEVGKSGEAGGSDLPLPCASVRGHHIAGKQTELSAEQSAIELPVLLLVFVAGKY
jgi:hypothetical protein